ncbi:MAG: hypothetical protein CMA72_05505 [Euryarchaeota archaeon]|jgi:hypothetical protein|nr:hypothetical protein [Euryarchaeota archaeon]|tara:strand:- start:2337 stop:3407 length:1071 start_codon:yes stop_codon:yes gene_type:complete
MDLVSAAWMTRSLGESVSAIHLDHDENLYAGGWNGSLRHWNSDGDLLWSSQLNDRITIISREGEYVFATAGLHITCLLATSGEIVWSVALEGSADSLVVFQQSLYAISSVYDIEHNDFLESAIWNFSFDGELHWVQKMDERPWVALEFENQLWFGLGRPKCGLIQLIDSEEQHHITTSADSPVTCGSTASSQILFGHSDGSVSDSRGKIISTEESSIDLLLALEKGYIAALENGNMVRRVGNETMWSSKGESVTVQAKGFALDGIATHWTGRWSGSEGVLQVRNCESGKVLASASCSRCESITATLNRVAVGYDNGDIRVWEAEMFSRRLDNQNEKEAPTKRNSALQDKLRALRDR